MADASDAEVIAQYAALRKRFERALVVQAGATPCPLTLQDFGQDPSGGVTFRLRGPCGDDPPLRVAFQLLAVTAAPGYDLVTGLGSVDAFNLVTGWGAPALVKSAVSVALASSGQSASAKR